MPLLNFLSLRPDGCGLLDYRAVEIAPDNGLVLNNIGWMFEQQGNLREAAKNYRRAIDLLGAGAPDQISTNLRNVETKLESRQGLQSVVGRLGLD